MTCTEQCWTPIKCPTCGDRVPPRGRSVALADYVGPCCEQVQYDFEINKCHLWDEHDGTRVYTDPEGWKAHEENCERCTEREEE